MPIVRVNGTDLFYEDSGPGSTGETIVFSHGLLFSTLAWEISRYHTFKIELEGHTEAGRAGLRPDYGNWELSTDRANAARRKLIQSGVDTNQVAKVAGFADTQPMADVDPIAEVNRRVTVLLKVGAVSHDL